MIGDTNKTFFLARKAEIVPQILSGQDNKKETFRMIWWIFKLKLWLPVVNYKEMSEAAN